MHPGIVLIFGFAVLVNNVVFAQGTIIFANRGGSSTTAAPGQTLAPIYYAESDHFFRISGNTSTGKPAGNTSYGNALRLDAGMGGGTWIATLWGVAGNQTAIGPDAAVSAGSPFQLLVNSAGQSSTTFRSSFPLDEFHGTFNQPSNPMIVPGAIASGPNTATFQVRVWDTRGGTVNTWAEVLAYPGLTRGYSDLFMNAFSLGGTEQPPNTPPFMQGFTSFLVVAIPEPSVIALASLTVGCVMTLRCGPKRKADKVDDGG